MTCDRSVVFSTNKTDRNDITEILLKVALNTINQIKPSDRTLILTLVNMVFYLFRVSFVFNTKISFNNCNLLFCNVHVHIKCLVNILNRRRIHKFV